MGREAKRGRRQRHKSRRRNAFCVALGIHPLRSGHVDARGVAFEGVDPGSSGARRRIPIGT